MRMKCARFRLLWLGLIFLLPCASWAQDSQTKPPYLDPSLTPEQRAADLVSRMTLDEKASQMQDVAVAIPRLGIPEYVWWNEALHGDARSGLATVFPQAIGLAATWDVELMHRIADTISTEARAKYNESIRNDIRGRYHGLTFWSPNINIFRDPRWGRGQETYGEDPFLTSRFGVAFIQGMQGDDPHYLKVVATAKHFAVHSGPEPLRHMFDVQPSTRDLEETYLPAFRASVVEGKVDSIMCAYNRIDGFPACANANLLQDHLRKDWGFQGYVVSDCGAITDIVNGHHYKPTMAEADVAAVEAGDDLSCGSEYSALVEAVHNGLIPVADVDRAVERLFVARFRLGMFDPPEMVPYSKIPYSENDSPEHRQLALEAAQESIVLLKNSNHTLPLSPKIRRIAVIGPAASDPDTMLGNYYGTPSKIVTPLDGVRDAFGNKADVKFSIGSTFTDHSDSLLPADQMITPPAGAAGGQPAHGLLAEYYANANFEGAPAVTRVEPRVYLHWDMRDPDIVTKIPRKQFSVRWSGTLRVPYSGEFAIGVIRLRCDDCLPAGIASARIYLDDQIILDESSQLRTSRIPSETKVKLEAGHDYRFRLEYKQDHGSVGVELLWRPPAEALLADAVQTVKDSDVTLAFLGLNGNLEGEEMNLNIPGFSGGDRTSLDLPEPQERLLEAAIATGKPVVLVLMSGSAISANYAEQHAAAILEAWYGGEQGGTAIAQTLAGENNPAGRLPVTFYRSVDQLPAFENYSMQGRTYRYFTGDPLFPFGFGMSYSEFRYSKLSVTPVAGAASQYDVTARVENTSDRDGDEVVELYFSRGPASGDAIRELRGLQRIHLKAHESRDVQFVLNAAPLDAADSTLPAPAPGPITVSVGGGQPLPGAQFVETTVRP
jgi:beta-glucosidase